MSGAPNPRRVTMFVAEKGLRGIETVEVDIVAEENRGPGFRTVSPRGLLPVLQLDDGTLLDESIAIDRYLEALHPEPGLFGATPLERAVVEQWERRMELDLLDGGAEAFRNGHPLFAENALPGATRWRAIPELAERGRARVAACLERMDARLGEVPYLGGARFSVADITGFCALDYVVRLAGIPVPDALRALRRWYEEVAARPSARATHVEVPGI